MSIDKKFCKYCNKYYNKSYYNKHITTKIHLKNEKKNIKDIKNKSLILPTDLLDIIFGYVENNEINEIKEKKYKKKYKNLSSYVNVANNVKNNDEVIKRHCGPVFYKKIHVEIINKIMNINIYSYKNKYTFKEIQDFFNTNLNFPNISYIDPLIESKKYWCIGLAYDIETQSTIIRIINNFDK